MFMPPLGLANDTAGREALLDRADIFIVDGLGATATGAGVDVGGAYLADSASLFISIPGDLGATGVGAGAVGAGVGVVGATDATGAVGAGT